MVFEIVAPVVDLTVVHLKKDLSLGSRALVDTRRFRVRAGIRGRRIDRTPQPSFSLRGRDQRTWLNTSAILAPSTFATSPAREQQNRQCKDHHRNRALGLPVHTVRVYADERCACTASRFNGVDEETVKTTLVERRVALSAELGRLTAPPEQGVGIGFGKRVGDGTTEAVERLATTATARSIAKSISEIDQALSRLNDGSYGLCQICGEAIPRARLDARPATVRCVGCSGIQD